MHPHFLCPYSKVYSIKKAWVGFWDENSLKFPVVHLHYLEHFGAIKGYQPAFGGM